MDRLLIEINEIGQWWGRDSKRRKQIQIDIIGRTVEGKDYIIVFWKCRNKKLV